METGYHGRPLPRPDEDIEDQGLGFDVGTLLQRRRILQALGVGAMSLGLAACATGTSASSATSYPSTADGEIPDETAGPYPGDGSNGPDVLEESGIVRSDIRSSFGDASDTARGIPLTLALNLKDLVHGGSAFAGVAVYVWHCDRSGRYSMYSSGIEDQNYLRGVQVADDAGTVTFTSIFPACYSGRWPHIHFEVYPDADSIDDPANAIATSQLALPKDACDAVYATDGYSASVKNLANVTLADDNVFGDDGGAHQLGQVTGNVEDGYAVSLTVCIDTTTEPSGGGVPGGGAPGGGGGTPPTGGPGGDGTPPSGAPGTSSTSS